MSRRHAEEYIQRQVEDLRADRQQAQEEAYAAVQSNDPDRARSRMRLAASSTVIICSLLALLGCDLYRSNDSILQDFVNGGLRWNW